MENSNENGWGEYSRLVLKELEVLAAGIKELNESMNEMKREIAEMRAREDRVDDLKAWKEKVDEVASPSQMLVKFSEVEELKQFNIKAVTIFAVVQFAMVLIVFVMKFM